MAVGRESGARALVRIGLAVSIALLMTCLTSVAAIAEPAADLRTESLWRGVVGDDSLFVLATWTPAAAPYGSGAPGASCWPFESQGSEDTTVLETRYLAYRIEDGSGRVRWSARLDDWEDHYFCTNHLWAQSTLWAGGLVIGVHASGCCCEPALACDDRRFHYFADGDSLAVSEWTEHAWNPGQDAPIDGWIDVDCLGVSMPMTAVVRDSAIAFDPILPAGIEAGQAFERGILDEDSFTSCPRRLDAPETTVEFFSSVEATVPERVVVRSTDTVWLQSALIRAHKQDGGLAFEVLRVGIHLSGRSGYVTRKDLTKIGYP